MTQSDSPIELLYRTYNSLFLNLPFRDIEETGTYLALFAQHCEAGFKKGKNPTQLIESFWEEYYENTESEDRLNLLFYFIQYVERQVVLFDSVEDALFEKTHEMNGPGSLRHLLTNLDTAEERAKVLDQIRNYSLRLVLTAHPTQFYPGKVLAIINDLGNEIKDNNLAQIRLLLMQLGKTAFFNRAKPHPLDEAMGLGWFMEHIFFYVLPDILYRLLVHLEQNPVE